MKTAAKRIEALSIPEPNSGCWIWLGTIKHKRMGYGGMAVDGAWRSAHRTSFRVFRGEIPEGMSVMHICDNGYCVNPDHLTLGTPQDNTADMLRKGRGNKGGPQWGRHRGGV